MYVRLCVAACWTMVASVRCVCVCVCVGSTSATDSPFPSCLSHVGGGQSLSPCVVCVSLGSGEGLVSFGLPPSSGAMVYEGNPRPLSPPHSLTLSLPPSVHS